MLHFCLNLLDAKDRNGGMIGDGLGGSLGNHSILGQNRACSRLHLQPAAILVLFSPDAAHGRASVAVNHLRTPGTRANSVRSGFSQQLPTLDCTRLRLLRARNAEASVQLIVEQSAARLIRLEPLA